MKDAFQSIGAELAASIVERFQSTEVRELADATKAAPDSDSGTFHVIITTENLDRYNEVIKLDGWELEHYRKNAIVLWGHDHNRPIGVATSIEIADGKMIAAGKFAPTDFAQEIRRLYDAGIVRATSVGFIEKEREGNLITKAELIEFSFVSVPANPYALSLAMEKGLGINELVTKGFMHVEKAANDDEPEAEPEEVAEVAEKGAVADEVADRDAWEHKWERFSKVDDIISSFWRVYFDNETAVEDFDKLLTETIELLKKVGGDEKAAPTGIITVIPGAARFVALEARSQSAALEGDDTTVVEPEEQLTEEEREYRAFSEKRKLLQDASTVIGEVLAESRRAIEASRAA